MHQTVSGSSTDGQQGKSSMRAGFRPDIEGLRAVAVLAVVSVSRRHAGVTGGFVGVDVFFVISGFLITGLLWREANSTGTVGLRRFYGARARRLLPASADRRDRHHDRLRRCCCPRCRCGPLSVTVSPARCMSAITGSSCEASTTSPTHVPASPFQHYWSLGVEEQFYLVWPALIIGTAWLIRLVRRRTKTEATSSKRPYVVVAYAGYGGVIRTVIWRYVRRRLLRHSFRCPPERGSWLSAGWWHLPLAGGAGCQHVPPRLPVGPGWP